MKKKFTFLIAALMLLTMFANPMGMRADEAQYVFNTDDGIAALGITKPSSSAGTSLSTTTPYTVGQISMSVTHGSTDTRVWNSSGTLDLRIYKSGGSLTFAAASGYNITGITIAGSAVGNFSVNVGTCSSGSWSNGTTGASSVTFTATNTGKINTITVTYSASGGSSLEDSDLALVDAPVELEFDLYDNANAQTISYTTSSTGAVTVSQSNYITATVNANNTITVTPVAVTNGSQTITVNQAADNTYAAGSVTFTVDIEDSTPTTGSDVTFDATTDKDLNNTTQGEGSIVKNGVTFTCSDGILGNGTEYRLYKNSTTTFSVTSGTITQIVFTCPSGNPASGFGNQTGWTTNGSNGTWTGSATSVSFVASNKQVRANTIVVTVETSGTPDPTISASNVDIAYSATSGSIAYTINDEPSPAGTLTVAVTEGNWLTLGQGTTSPIAFTCTANENTTARTATVTLTYAYGNNESVTKDVTVTQAAAPVTYTTITDLFAGATSTETGVLVTFNNWVVSGVSTDGKSVFITDNAGNGFVIYNKDGGLNNTYTAGNILSGTAVSCTLKKFNGFTELNNVDAASLTFATGGTVTAADVALADLAGVNTGALVHYDNLTCSITDNKYYLSDGTTTLQVYNALYAFDALTAGKTYTITGVYQQYNSTKEILPRSASDIEEVQVQHNEYTLTVSNLVHVNTYVFDASDQTNPLLTGAGIVNIYDGTEVMISVDVDQDYVISSLIVDGSDVTSQIVADAYTFTMPTHAVTVTATAVESVTPLTPTSTAYVRISDLSQLTDGCKVVIAARYNDVNTNGYYAMTAATSGKPAGTAFTSTTSNNKEILPSNITNSIDTYYWTVNVTDDGYTFTNASNQVIGWSSSTNFTTGGNNTTWTITRETSDNVAMVGGYTGYVIRNGNSDTRAFALNGTPAFGPYSTNNMNTSGYNFCLDFFVYAETYTYTIEAYTVGQGTTGNPTDGWYLISSPVNWNITPTASTGFITNTYDLYRFNQSGTNGEWENWRQHGFMLANGKGYLYANSAGTTLTFTGAPVSGTTKTVDLDYAAETEFSGVNLVGNPFPVNAITDKSYYVMNSARTGIEATAVSAGTAIVPFTGVIVVATGTGQSVTFTKQSQSSTGSTNNNGYVNIVLSQQVNRGNATLDKAVLSFNDGDELGKFYFGTQDANLYFAMSDKDYAIATAEAQGEMPVCFKANQDGEYTITINAEEVEMNYLHLIDNMTGADIDLLANPSYTFNATTTDYASRFRLVFKANGVDEISSENGNFAFMSNGQLIITNEGEALLQVVDITGRVISTESVNGTCSKALNAPAGVYVLRLINGETTKTQKIVVK